MNLQENNIGALAQRGPSKAHEIYLFILNQAIDKHRLIKNALLMLPST